MKPRFPEDSPLPRSGVVPPEMHARLVACSEAERTELEKTWHMAGLAVRGDARADVERAWAKHRAQVAPRSAFPTVRWIRSDRFPAGRSAGRISWPIAVPLAFLAFLALGVTFWIWPVTINALPGTTASAILPDGSHVELNCGSRLSYRRGFLTGREVTLVGEAFFEIVPAGQSFRVKTFNASVEVLGTHFNVRAWPDDASPETVVTLTSGAVAVASKAMPERLVQLKPGQMNRVSEQAILPSNPIDASVEQMLAWRNGGFAFNNQPLGNIFAELERRFDIKIVTASPTIEQDSLVLFIEPTPHAETILEAISSFRGYQYQATEDGFVIHAPDE